MIKTPGVTRYLQLNSPSARHSLSFRRGLVFPDQRTGHTIHAANPDPLVMVVDGNAGLLRHARRIQRLVPALLPCKGQVHIVKVPEFL